MPQDTKNYKVVRRGQKYCVRVKGMLNTTDTFNWCRERNMSYHIKQHWQIGRTWNEAHHSPIRWDYDFIFEQKKEAFTFILGYL